MTTSGMSQKEYLKKYLSAGGDDKKKKKKKLKANPVVSRLRIVDDDVDIHNMRPLDEGELELYELQEDAPQIAGIIDERPEEVKIKEKFGSKKWKVVADENDMGVKIIDKSKPNDVLPSTQNSVHQEIGESNDNDLSPPRKSIQYSDKTTESESMPRNKNSQKHDSSRKESTGNIQVRKTSQRYDSDESPPRKYKKDGSDESPPRRNGKANSDNTSFQRKIDNNYSDESPPRKSCRNDRKNKNQSRKRNIYDSDTSPPRKNETENSSPPRRQQHYDSDESPPRRKKKSNLVDSFSHNRGQKYDSDASPPRKNRNNSSQKKQPHINSMNNDSDESPPRKTKGISESLPREDTRYKLDIKTNHRGRKESPSGSRRKENNGLRRENEKKDSDESPPRRQRRRDSITPDKGKRRDSISPPKRQRERMRTSRSPVRNKIGRDVEGAPRRSRWGEADSAARSVQKDFSKSKTTQGPHYKEFTANSSRKTFDKNDEKKDGRNYSSQRKSDHGVSPERRTQSTSKDDSTRETLDGRKAGLVGAGELKAEIEDLRQKEKDMFEKMDVSISGRGAAPIMRDRKTGKKRDLEEETREKQLKDLKQAERDAKYMQWGRGLKQVTDKAQKMEEDLYEMSKPLARYADDADLDKYLRYQEREGDPMLDYIRSKHKSQGDNKGKPRYEGSFMPNRFGIRPGYRWDGVDRSSGYEKQWFETQNAKKAVEEEAYKWSTSDM